MFFAIASKSLVDSSLHALFISHDKFCVPHVPIVTTWRVSPISWSEILEPIFWSVYSSHKQMAFCFGMNIYGHFEFYKSEVFIECIWAKYDSMSLAIFKNTFESALDLQSPCAPILIEWSNVLAFSFLILFLFFMNTQWNLVIMHFVFEFLFVVWIFECWNFASSQIWDHTRKCSPVSVKKNSSFMILDFMLSTKHCCKDWFFELS